MTESKTLLEWEETMGLMFTGDVHLDRKLVGIVPGSEPQIDDEEKDELQAYMRKNPYLGVNHADRTKFLEDNGYEVTRENMMNVELSAKPPEA